MADRIVKKTGRVKPGINFRAMFFLMKMNQKANDWNLVYKDYWIKKGWLKGR